MRQTVPNLPSTTAVLAYRETVDVSRPVPEKVEDKPAQMVSKKQWERVIGLIADGVRVNEAITSVGLARYTLEGILRTDTKRKEQWEDAKIAAIRRLWDFDILEDILCDIATGKSVKDSVGGRGLDTHGFYKLVLNDPVSKQMYDDALKIQAETMADEIIEIADYKENDQWLDADKGIWKTNSEVVNRSRLKVDARKWKMAKLHWKRFGDKVQQEVNANIVVDHAARLEEARQRARLQDKVVSVQEKQE